MEKPTSGHLAAMSIKQTLVDSGLTLEEAEAEMDKFDAAPPDEWLRAKEMIADTLKQIEQEIRTTKGNSEND